jgi:predicted permease
MIFMSSLGEDVRQAVRALRLQPVFTLMVVLSIALGIGANTTVFAWLDSLVRRPFPAIPAGESLVVLNVADANGQVSGMAPIAYPVLTEWTSRTSVFSGVSAHAQLRLNLRDHLAGGGQPIWAEITAANFFETLGVRPFRGRFFLPTDEADRAAIAVLSHALWQSRFGSADILGRAILVNGVPLTVVGIGPPRFGGVVTGLAFDAWVPLWTQPLLLPGGDWMRDRNARRLQAVARLRPGVSLSQAQQNLNSVAREVSRSLGESSLSGAGVRWIGDSQLGSLMGPLGSAMIGLTGVVLLTACANVAGLFLARGVTRQRQTAIQVAIGASRRHLIQQAFVHAVILGALGGLVGLVIARITKDSLRAFVPRVSLPVSIEIDLNWSVVGFALATTAIAALAFALVPAIRASHPDVIEVLKGASSRSGTSRSRLRLGLVVAQVAFSAMILATAGLFLRSVLSASRVPLGFDNPAGVLLVSTDLAFTRLNGGALAGLVDEMLEGVRREPGVASAALASFVPLSFGGPPGILTRVDHYVPGADEGMFIDRASVSDGYFDVMGIPIVEGRGIATVDRADNMRVVVVNQAFVARYWPGQPAIGRRIDQGDGWATVVGVAKDAVVDGLSDPVQPLVYHPWAQLAVTSVTLHVRSTGGDALALVAPVRRALTETHADLVALDPGTLADHMQAAVFVQSVGASAFSVFGLIAVAITAVGLYGVVAQYAAERTRELAIAVAIGASPLSIAVHVTAPVFKLTAVGLVIGAVLAIGSGALVRNQLIGVGNLDLQSIAGSVLLLAAVTVVSCAWPTWQATRTDPVSVIRPD